MKSIIIVGASQDRRKYSNKAVRAYLKKGWHVFPVNPNHEEIEGIKCFKTIDDVNEEAGMASLYVRPEVGMGLVEQLVKKRIERVILNPGADSPELVAELRQKGITPLLVCSIISLGEDPENY